MYTTKYSDTPMGGKLFTVYTRDSDITDVTCTLFSEVKNHLGENPENTAEVHCNIAGVASKIFFYRHDKKVDAENPYTTKIKMFRGPVMIFAGLQKPFWFSKTENRDGLFDTNLEIGVYPNSFSVKLDRDGE